MRGDIDIASREVMTSRNVTNVDTRVMPTTVHISRFVRVHSWVRKLLVGLNHSSEKLDLAIVIFKLVRKRNNRS